MSTLAKQALLSKSEAISSMLGYLERSEHAGYTEEHVDECDRLLREYLRWTSARQEIEAIREQTRVLVLALNELNRRCGGTLIETDQREAICSMIIKAASNAGYPDDDDFTEEWREW